MLKIMIVKQCGDGHRAELQLQLHWACVQGWVSCKVKHHEGQGAGAGQWKVTSSQEGGHSLTPTHTHTLTRAHNHTHTHSCVLDACKCWSVSYGLHLKSFDRQPLLP